MSIAIDKVKCRGCGKCTEVCPGSLIKRMLTARHISDTRETAGAAAHVLRNATLMR